MRLVFCIFALIAFSMSAEAKSHKHSGKNPKPVKEVIAADPDTSTLEERIEQFRVNGGKVTVLSIRMVNAMCLRKELALGPDFFLSIGSDGCVGARIFTHSSAPQKQITALTETGARNLVREKLEGSTPVITATDISPPALSAEEDTAEGDDDAPP